MKAVVTFEPVEVTVRAIERVVREMRQAIQDELGLPASAGVAADDMGANVADEVSHEHHQHHEDQLPEADDSAGAIEGHSGHAHPQPPPPQPQPQPQVPQPPQPPAGVSAGAHEENMGWIR